MLHSSKCPLQQANKQTKPFHTCCLHASKTSMGGKQPDLIVSLSCRLPQDLLPAIWFIFSRKRCELATLQLHAEGITLTTPVRSECLASRRAAAAAGFLHADLARLVPRAVSGFVRVLGLSLDKQTRMSHRPSSIKAALVKAGGAGPDLGRGDGPAAGAAGGHSRGAGGGFGCGPGSAPRRLPARLEGPHRALLPAWSAPCHAARL